MMIDNVMTGKLVGRRDTSVNGIKAIRLLRLKSRASPPYIRPPIDITSVQGRFCSRVFGYISLGKETHTVKHIYAFFVAAIVALGLTPALADPPYVDTACGTWTNDEWVPNGTCPPGVKSIRHDTVSGTITIVKGHLVTVQQSTRTIVINDEPALIAKQTGKVAVGRMIVAYGYWMDNNFYATAIY